MSSDPGSLIPRLRSKTGVNTPFLTVNAPLPVSLYPQDIPTAYFGVEGRYTTQVCFHGYTANVFVPMFRWMLPAAAAGQYRESGNRRFDDKYRRTAHRLIALKNLPSALCFQGFATSGRIGTKLGNRQASPAVIIRLPKEAFKDAAGMPLFVPKQGL